MRKLAVFVEGHTELVFMEKLVVELAGYHQVHIARQVLHGDQIRQLYSVGVEPANAEFFVLIVNCESDGKVKSAILERTQGLQAQGYELVLGVRDVYPNKHAELEKLRNGMSAGLDAQPVATHIVLAVMEVEAWFIGESTHFQRVDPALTPAYIKATHGIDVEDASVETIRHPATTLGLIYRSVGRDYKREAEMPMQSRHD